MTSNTSDGPTFIMVPAGTDRYWEDWAVLIPEPADMDGRVRIRTIRDGRDGESDARFIIDRLASGLYAAALYEVPERFCENADCGNELRADEDDICDYCQERSDQ
jgi:hypothetical protein